MEYIVHRVNTVGELRKIPNQYGVELDIRDDLEGNIYLQHNPFEPGESFEAYLQEYHHGTMIVNVKSERVELRAAELLRKYKIENYFFLDSTFPMIKLLTDRGETKIALRYSEYEGMDTLLNMAGMVQWVWVDCFTKMPLTREVFRQIKQCGYKICLVSPDLVGRGEEIESYREMLDREQIELDAVCSKVYNIDRWRNRLIGKV